MAKSARTTSDPETHDKERWAVISPHTYQHNGEEHTSWLRHGSAFPTKDGGFTLKLRSIPVAGADGELTIIIKKRGPKDEAGGENWDLP